MHVHLSSRTDMEENLDRMLEKLNRILDLVRDVNSTLKRIETLDESRDMNNVPSDDVRDSRVIKDVYVSFTVISVIEDLLTNSDTQISDEIHEFSESTMTMYMCESSLKHLYLLMSLLMIMILVMLSVSQ